MTKDEVDAALRAARVAPETEVQKEQRIADEMQKLLSDNGMGLSVSIIKVPVQVAPGQFVFADKPIVEVKAKKVEIARPDVSGAINQAVKNTAMKLVH